MERSRESYCYSWSIDPAEHLFREVPFSDFLRTDLQNPDIAVYWHALTKNWVVCVRFQKKGRPVMWELRVLNHDPDGDTPILTPENLSRLRARWFQPEDPRDVARDLACERSSYTRHIQDEDRARLSTNQFLARRLALKNPVRLARNPSLSSAARQQRVYA